MKFENIVEEIKKNKKNHDEGYFNCIPFLGFERLEKLIPGIENSTYIIITASSGIGKSKFARFLFIHSPLQYLEQHPETDIKLDILYFSLEESKEKIVLSEISRYLYTKYDVVVSVKQLQSRGRYNTISPDIIEKISEAREYVENFLNKVKIYDSIRNPTGIYLAVRNHAMTIGKYYDKNDMPLTDKEHMDIMSGRTEAFKKISYYKKDDEKHFVIVLTDHISLLETEKDSGISMTQWQTMSKFSNKYCLHMRDKFGFTVVNVQQQASSKEQVEYNYQGRSIEEKLEPSLDALGDNKTTQRDANLVLGLFAPERYRIPTHNGFDITYFRDNYRNMKILKDRDGVANASLALFFNGATDIFKELPNPTDIDAMNEVRQYLNRMRENG